MAVLTQPSRNMDAIRWAQKQESRIAELMAKKADKTVVVYRPGTPSPEAEKDAQTIKEKLSAIQKTVRAPQLTLDEKVAGLKKHCVLRSYGYPVSSSPKLMICNANAILDTLQEYGKAVFFVGIGTSGAMIASNILVVEQLRCDMSGASAIHDAILLRKETERCHRGQVEPPISIEHPVPLVVVDDLIDSGRTLENISYILGERKEWVIGVAVRNANWGDTPYSLVSWFPNLKFIIY
jgi:hypothetical protein